MRKRINVSCRCVHHCPYFQTTVKTEAEGIGIYKKFNVRVLDTLCGCRTRNGKTVLLNFNLKGADDHA